jgi:hypothetical protein
MVSLIQKRVMLIVEGRVVVADVRQEWPVGPVLIVPMASLAA